MHRRKGILNGHHVVAAFAAAKAFLFDLGGRRGDHRYIYLLRVCLRNYLSGWWNLNPRPDAAETARLEPGSKFAFLFNAVVHMLVIVIEMDADRA
jgi:hypothetical protein